MNRIKIYATPESAAAFKDLCAKNGTSVARLSPFAFFANGRKAPLENSPASGRSEFTVTAELSAYMRKRTHLKEPVTTTGNGTDKRLCPELANGYWQRRASVGRIIPLLEKILAAEESYRDNIPENLRCAPMAEAAEEAVGHLIAAIEELTDAYATGS